ncbi:MAG: tetratricopeptide repeat protein [Prevotellaceae bacterium]|jgi:tetratricopeptide (TPR) repeat protein|nr:tetratricopeptide repeat protein [Prevotellaceae bacterium]
MAPAQRILLALALAAATPLAAEAGPLSWLKDMLNPSPEYRRREQTYFFCEGKKSVLLGSADEATRYFKKAIKADPRCDACHYELSGVYAATNHFKEAAEHAQLAYAIDSSNAWYTLLLAQLFASEGDNAQAQRYYEKLIAQDVQNRDAYYELLTLYYRQKLYDKAIDLLALYRQAFGTDEESVLLEQDVLFKQGKLSEAVAKLHQLVALHPDKQKYWLLLADLHGVSKMDSLSLEALAQAKAIDSTSFAYWEALSAHYRRVADFDSYFRCLLHLFADAATPTLYRQQVLTFLQEFPAVERNYLPTMDSLYALARATFSYQQEGLYTVYLLRKGRLDSALAVLENLTRLGKADERLNDVIANGQESRHFAAYSGDAAALFSSWMLYLDLLITKRSWDLLLQVADSCEKTFPDAAYKVHYIKGLSFFQKKNYASAKEVWKKSLEAPEAKADTAFLMQLYSSLGDVCFSLKEHAEASRYFDRALALDANNILVLNNYAYYLSQTNKKLKKALAMSKITLDAEPENPTYLDTYAWILYCLGRYADSKQIFRKALVKGGMDDPVMLEHYGDVLYKLQEYSNAQIYWQRVIEKGGNSPELQEKIKNLKQ